MQALSRYLRWIWSHDVSLGVFLALLIAFVFFLLPLAGYQDSTDLVASLVAAALVLSGSVAVIGRVWVRRLVVLVVASMIAVRCAGAVSGDTILLVGGAILTTLVLALLVLLFLGEVYRPGPITRFRVMGGIAAYLMLGMTWAYVYALIEFAAPGSLRLPGPGEVHLNSPHFRADVVYFSFVTLTTLGYGDIVPVGAFLRSMATLEALIGQLYIATLIGRLVSLRPPSPTRRQGEPPTAE